MSNKNNENFKVFICTYMLPVDLRFCKDTNSWSCEFEERLLFEDGPLYYELGKTITQRKEFDAYFVGCPPCEVDESQRKDVEKVLAEKHCFPVWIDKEVRDENYLGFCKSVLWPIFHNDGETVKRESEDSEIIHEDMFFSSFQTRLTTRFEAYKKVNDEFSNLILTLCGERDIVWIHDYHFLLLPRYLSKKRTAAKIGLFIHAPFPSSTIFKWLPMKAKLLKGMLAADHIGFHLFEYVRHFHTACQRELGLTFHTLEKGLFAIKYRNRFVSLTCSHAGVNPEYIKEKLKDENVQDMIREFDMGHELKITKNKKHGRKKHEVVKTRQKLILGVDEIVDLKGIVNKFRSFDFFLEKYKYKQAQSNVVLRQIGITPERTESLYGETLEAIKNSVATINKKYGRIVIEFEQVSACELRERLALYVLADVLLLTSIREGLNMVPFEFVVANAYSKYNHPGVCLISELAAASVVLPGCLKTSPAMIHNWAGLIDRALMMPSKEKKARSDRNMAFIRDNTIELWASRFLADINDAKRVEKDVTRRFAGLVLSPKKSNDSEPVALDSLLVCEAYTKAKKRVFFIDYSGTLVETSEIYLYMKEGGLSRMWHYEKKIGSKPGGSLETRDPIPTAVKELLVSLTKDPKNHVVLVSGDLKEELAEAVAGITNLGLIAENGYTFRLNENSSWENLFDYERNTEKKKEGKDFQDISTMVSLEDPKLLNWQEGIVEIMVKYRKHTNASFIFRVPTSVSFNFVLSDPQHGYFQAEMLWQELNENTRDLPVSIELGKGHVTARLQGVNRGAAAAAILAKLNESAKEGDIDPYADFVMGFGDDIEDDPLFTTLTKYSKRLANVKVYQTIVGFSGNVSSAKYFLEDQSALCSFLAEVVEFAQDTGSAPLRTSSSVRIDTKSFSSNFKIKSNMTNIEARMHNQTQRSRKLFDHWHPSKFKSDSGKPYYLEVSSRPERILNTGKTVAFAGDNEQHDKEETDHNESMSLERSSSRVFASSSSDDGRISDTTGREDSFSSIDVLPARDDRAIPPTAGENKNKGRNWLSWYFDAEKKTLVEQMKSDLFTVGIAAVFFYAVIKPRMPLQKN
eukprot:maker-scaffold_24-snap-gene-2.4-mRNA-1 protein AED:0.10 eAED:0.10 QI:0/1/0.33/1/1/1/3/0/1085